ncbi:aminotransferase [Sandaracinobacteroides saxicola]|uniref:Aminotransferase n=1 Tax=Sandaracinobacteroides saxicola TaxID=2759707 RepID=A0A7G5IF43_9SPHN|nr:aminotransferase [Sandaracinobacteroides saxicola]QMW21985.1 aminotransferase [Sandaracinobacteroides saxicola]
MSVLIAPKTTVFEATSAACRASGAINLGQGFPDGCGPLAVREAAARAVIDGPHHYPPMAGLPELRVAVADHYARHLGLAIEPMDGVTVTSGATEALACAIFALVEPGDAVVIIEPAYDAYAPLVRRAGGVVRAIEVRPPDWRIDRQELARAAEGARLLIVNDPVNPCGTRLHADDRAALADAVLANDAWLLCDEVWEWVLDPGVAHASMLADARLAARTVKVGSAGKIFALTGWKVGWLCAAPALGARLRAVHQFLTFTTPPSLQMAVARGLADDAGWLAAMRAEIAGRRARLAAGLREAGYAVLPSDATWFLNVDLAASGVAMDDAAFNARLIADHGVAGIPVSAFYENDGPRHILRLCHAKAAATLDAAVARLGAALRAVT